MKDSLKVVKEYEMKENLKAVEAILEGLNYGELVIKVVEGKIALIEKKEQFKILTNKGEKR